MNYIGIDGGGTKTAFVLFDQDGHKLDELVLPTCHFLQVGFESCADILYEGILTIVNRYHLEPINLKIGIGIAGYGNDQNICDKIENTIHQKIYKYHYYITNDMHIALIGALNNQDGIAVIAGTGSIAMAKINDSILRCGGWGYQLDDEGSAYWIGKELLKLFCQQADGRKSRTQVYTSIMEYCHLENPYKLINYYSQLENPRMSVAKLAYLCDHLSCSGEEDCQNILKNASLSVRNLVNGLRKYFNSPVLVTYYGGVFKSEFFKKFFLDELEGNIEVIQPMFDAPYGAYLFAKNQ